MLPRPGGGGGVAARGRMLRGGRSTRTRQLRLLDLTPRAAAVEAAEAPVSITLATVPAVPVMDPVLVTAVRRAQVA